VWLRSCRVREDRARKAAISVRKIQSPRDRAKNASVDLETILPAVTDRQAMPVDRTASTRQPKEQH
jgi:hypothetical protein